MPTPAKIALKTPLTSNEQQFKYLGAGHLAILIAFSVTKCILDILLLKVLRASSKETLVVIMTPEDPLPFVEIRCGFFWQQCQDIFKINCKMIKKGNTSTLRTRQGLWNLITVKISNEGSHVFAMALCGSEKMGGLVHVGRFKEGLCEEVRIK